MNLLQPRMKLWTRGEPFPWPVAETSPEAKEVQITDSNGVLHYVRYLGDAVPTQDDVDAQCNPPPSEITQRQFWQQAVAQGLCNQGQAIAASASANALPPNLQAAMSKLTTAHQFQLLAELRSPRFSLFDLDAAKNGTIAAGPMPALLLAAQNWTVDQLLHFWRAASAM